MIEPPLDGLDDANDRAVGFARHVDGDLRPIVEERDPLGAIRRAEPVGERAGAAGGWYNDSHFHHDPPQPMNAPTRLLRVDLCDADSFGYRSAACRADRFGPHAESITKRLALNLFGRLCCKKEMAVDDRRRDVRQLLATLL